MAPPTRARWGLLVPAAVVALVAAACGSSSTTSSGTSGSGPVKIGFFGALTGNNSPQLGININNGVKLAVQQYNAKGGGPKVTLTEYDSQGDPAQAPQLAQKVISDHTVAVVGPAFSGESKVADPIFQQGQIVNVTPSATNPSLATHGWTYWHRAVGNDNHRARLPPRTSPTSSTTRGSPSSTTTASTARGSPTSWPRPCPRAVRPFPFGTTSTPRPPTIRRRSTPSTPATSTPSSTEATTSRRAHW